MLPRSLQNIRRAPAFLRSPQHASSRLHTLTIASKLKPLSHLPPCCRPGYTGLPLLLGARGVASEVTNRPGSQTPKQAATNIKEEVGNTATSVAKTIAGANFAVDSVKPNEDNFSGITAAVANAVPKEILVFGLAGGLPYLGTSATVVYLARQAGLAAAGYSVGIDPGVALTVLDQALNIQVTYGAVMLSFLGALHWGMEFAGLDGKKGYARLSLGAAPVVYGWSTLALDPTYALISQFVGFIGLWWADMKTTNAGWTPKWYSQYRFYLTALVGACIIGSLAGTSYFGPVAGHGIDTHNLNVIRSERKKHVTEGVGKTGGNLEALQNDEKADSYVSLKKKPEESEAKEGNEGNEEKEGGKKNENESKGEDKGQSEDKKE
ncbi:hypothetical protein DFH11DRAFT_1579454 [Phellopilus nigrolimitatus]|nr:hypothetical protein DFH11DRAFT_1579454 [Phellopilus nigrolimitatus]